MRSDNKVVNCLFIASDTDIGKKRSENQDRVYTEFLADNVAVAVVCDGMGGASSGGVASQLAIDAVVKRKFPQRYETKFHKKPYAHFRALCEYACVWQEQGGH